MFKSYKRGITIIEIVVVITIITLFSSILVANFPSIQRQYALSRAAYKLAQNLRKVQDLGLSGVKITDSLGEEVHAKGYGIYIDVRTQPAQDYILYADTCPSDTADSRYTTSLSCDYNGDYVIDTVNVNEDNSGVYIKSILNNYDVDAYWTSINFTPPNPNIDIENIGSGNTIEIVLSLLADPAKTKSVIINSSGLINVE